ncbi:MAG: hypothetical protein J0L92_07295 [Deltaproteobacteria bacterium]|nr:hypothetical protein [Deltaproteobacteria bacterium]
MSVVRIPGAEEDLFPWPRVAVAVIVGGALGLGIAYWGMERDRSVDADAATSAPESDMAVARPEVLERPEAATVVEQTAADRPASDRLEDATQPEPDLDAGDVTVSAQPVEEPAEVPIEEPTEETPHVAAGSGTPGVPTAARVAVRRGRVAYLRCEGVPQREGPFPCPRDEPLEDAVWDALRTVERCGAPPPLGQADIVLDFEGEAAPTIRARDTFPADTTRTDDAALLACTAESLGNVTSSLRPRRLVVSFRLTLDPAAD